MHKRHLIVLAMMVAIGVFFAGLTIARADSGDDGSDDPTPTCTLPGNDQGDENDQAEDVNDQVIDRIQNGTALFAYYPDRDWLSSSPFLHCDGRVAAR